jgi:hypothetical protein
MVCQHQDSGGKKEARRRGFSGFTNESAKTRANLSGNFLAQDRKPLK